MKRMNNKTYRIVLFTIATMILGACSLNTEPTGVYTEDTFWYGAENARTGLNACYLTLRDGSFTGGIAMAMEESVTPNAYNYDDRSGWNSIALGQHTVETAIFNNRWSSAYDGISRCNLLLAKIDGNKELKNNEVEQMKAQARFLRALYYSTLITYYYEVPLITDAPSMSQTTLPRTDRHTILQFLLNELDAIDDIIPLNPAEKGRVTKGAVLALKARLLLFEASALCNPTNDPVKWCAAADAAFAVMDLKKYDLYPDYRRLFLEEAENGVESIFDVQCIKTPNGLGHSLDVVMRQWNNAAPLKGLIDAYWTIDGTERINPTYGSWSGDVWTSNTATYNNLDPRFAKTIVYPGSTFMGETVKDDQSNSAFRLTMTGYTFKKYTVYDAERPADAAISENCSPVNLMILRYADILLMYAEAKNELGELTAEVWDKTVKRIRQRAGFSAAAALDYPGSDYATLTKHLRYERRIEFAGEGMYYNDLRRWKTAGTEMDNLDIHDMKGQRITTRLFNAERDYWWPVPAMQLILNPALYPNNEGWN
jgi:hypothetical protein